MRDFRRPPRLRRAKGSLYNLIIVSAIGLALAFVLYGTAYRLWPPPTRLPGWIQPLPDLNLKYVYLLLLMDYLFALWVAWHTPTTRVIGLAIIGALLGLGTELTAHYAGMWIYGNVHMIGGILIYSLSTITLFGMVYLINLFLSRIPFMRTTGWFNAALVVLVFLTLYATAANSDYMERIRRHYYVQIYYWALFSFAVTIAFSMRLSTLLSALIAAPLLSVSGLYAGGTHGQIWTFLPLQQNGPCTFPPVFLFIAIWPMECLVEYGLSALISDFLSNLFKVRKQQRIEDRKEPVPGSREKFIPPSEHLEIPFYDYNPSRESMTSFLLRIL